MYSAPEFYSPPELTETKDAENINMQCPCE